MPAKHLFYINTCAVPVGWISELVGLLKYCHGDGGEAHGPHEDELGQVEAGERPLGLPQPVEDAQPEQQQQEQEEGLKQ